VTALPACDPDAGLRLDEVQGVAESLEVIHLFGRVFVLKLGLDTLERRLAARPENKWGSKPAEQRLIRRLHATREDLARTAAAIDATAPIDSVVDAILRECSGCVSNGPK
jgi:hypothetical protein